MIDFKGLIGKAAALLQRRPPIAGVPVQTSTTLSAHTTSSAPRKRREPWVPTTIYGKAFCWVLSPILDPHDNYPSGPRCMAWYIAVIAVKHEIGAALASMLLGTMWGYSAWKANQEKTTSTLSAVQNITANYTHTYSETVQRIVDGRMPEHGFDPSKPVLDPSGGEK